MQVVPLLHDVRTSHVLQEEELLDYRFRLCKMYMFNWKYTK